MSKEKIDALISELVAEAVKSNTDYDRMTAIEKDIDARLSHLEAEVESKDNFLKKLGEESLEHRNNDPEIKRLESAVETWRDHYSHSCDVNQHLRVQLEQAERRGFYAGREWGNRHEEFFKYEEYDDYKRSKQEADEKQG